MGTIFFDECLQNLYYAQEAMKDWIPLSDYEIIFEAVNPDVKAKITQNEETADKSKGFIRRAIDAVIRLIGQILSPLKNFLDTFTMDSKERQAYEEFKKRAAQDPKLKNRKISVADFRKVTAAYNKIQSELENEIRLVQQDANHPIEEITAKITNFLKGNVTAAASIVAVDAATKIADSNIEMAKQIKNVLEEEESIMNTLSQTLGKKDAARFKKDIDAAAKNTRLHQLKVKLFRHKYDSLQECIEGTFDSLKSITSAWGAVGGFFKSDTHAMEMRALKNKDLRDTGIAAYKIVTGSKKELKRREKEEAQSQRNLQKAQKKMEKEASKPKPTDGIYKSKESFITGKK